MKDLRSILIILIILLAGSSLPAMAQIVVEEGKIVRSARPGETIVEEFRVHNRSDRALPIRAYWKDFQYRPPFQGEKEFLAHGTVDSSFHGWASFSPNEFILPPYGRQTVRYSFKIPENADRGYHGVLFFETDTAGEGDTNVGLNVVTRIGTLFFIQPETAERSAAIRGISALENTLSGKLVNTGDMTLSPEGIYYLLDEEGMVASRGQEVTRLFLPPGEEGVFECGLKGSLEAGRYTMILTFDLGEGVSSVKEIDLIRNTTGNLEIRSVRD